MIDGSTLSRQRIQGVLFWASSGLAVAALALVVANAVLVSHNRTIQAEVNQRQQFINESLQLSRVNEALVRGLATTAANTNDDRLRALLAQHGITFTVNAPGQAAPQGRPAAPAPAESR